MTVYNYYCIILYYFISTNPPPAREHRDHGVSGVQDTWVGVGRKLPLSSVS